MPLLPPTSQVGSVQILLKQVVWFCACVHACHIRGGAPGIVLIQMKVPVKQCLHNGMSSIQMYECSASKEISIVGDPNLNHPTRRIPQRCSFTPMITILTSGMTTERLKQPLLHQCGEQVSLTWFCAFVLTWRNSKQKLPHPFGRIGMAKDHVQVLTLRRRVGGPLI